MSLGWLAPGNWGVCENLEIDKGRREQKGWFDSNVHRMLRWKVGMNILSGEMRCVSQFLF